MFSRPSTPPRSALLALLLVGLLSSCAPTILGRTPQPAAPGEAEVSLTLGYPFIELTHLPPGSVCAPASPPDECYAPGYGGPAYLPVAYPLNLLVAYGLEGGVEHCVIHAKHVDVPCGVYGEVFNAAGDILYSPEQIARTIQFGDKS